MKHKLRLAVSVLMFAVLLAVAIVTAAAVKEWQQWVPHPHVLSTSAHRAHAAVGTTDLFEQAR